MDSLYHLCHGLFIHCQSRFKQSFRCANCSDYLFPPIIFNGPQKSTPYLIIWNKNFFCLVIISHVSHMNQ